MAVLLLRVRSLSVALLGRVVGRDGLLPAVVLAELVNEALVVLPALDGVPVVEEVGQVNARNVPGSVEDSAKRWFGVRVFFELFVWSKSGESFDSPQIELEWNSSARSICGVLRRRRRC